MADQVNKAGRVEIKVQQSVGAGNLKKLGESIDMTDVEDRSFWHNVPGDRRGGPQGPPIEVQYLGSIYIVRMELSRWDPTVYDELITRNALTALGAPALTDCGKLMLEDNAIRLLLHSTTRPMNFPCAILRDSVQFGMGTKYTGVALQFECHVCIDGTARDGTLYDSDTAEYTT